MLQEIGHVIRMSDERLPKFSIDNYSREGAFNMARGNATYTASVKGFNKSADFFKQTTECRKKGICEAKRKHRQRKSESVGQYKLDSLTLTCCHYNRQFIAKVGRHPSENHLTYQYTCKTNIQEI